MFFYQLLHSVIAVRIRETTSVSSPDILNDNNKRNKNDYRLYKISGRHQARVMPKTRLTVIAVIYLFWVVTTTDIVVVSMITTDPEGNLETKTLLSDIIIGIIVLWYCQVVRFFVLWSRLAGKADDGRALPSPPPYGEKLVLPPSWRRTLVTRYVLHLGLGNWLFFICFVIDVPWFLVMLIKT